MAMQLTEPVITEAQREMALKIARGFVRKLPRNVLVEDLEQAALLGLWDGLQKNAGREQAPEQLEWYLRVRIRGAILDELRTEDWIQRRLRREEREGRAEVRVLHGADTSGALRWEETIVSPEADVDERLDEEGLAEAAIQALGDSARGQRERRVIRQHYYHGHKFKDIGNDLGVSEPRISQLHARAIRKMRAALKEEHEPGASDRRTGSPAAEDRPADAVAGAVPGSGLARPPAEAAPRLVPRRARGAELGGEAREELHGAGSATRDAGAPADPGGGLAVTEPVPSVLPEEGIDLAAELERYRCWLIEQALIRTDGNIIAAGKLLGYRHKTSLYAILRKRAHGATFRKGGAAHRDDVRPAAPAEAPAPELPPPAHPTSVEALPQEPPSTALQLERRLARLMERIPWQRVEQLRAEGLDDFRIAQKLASGLDTNRLLLQRALERRREAEAASVPWEQQP